MYTVYLLFIILELKMKNDFNFCIKLKEFLQTCGRIIISHNIDVYISTVRVF